jgi:uncharacterized membrane protein
MVLVHFPIAFLTGAFLFDLAGTVLSKPGLFPVAAYLLVVGLLSGLMAAAPGVVDYPSSVPKGGAAQRDAIRHSITSVASLGLFAVAWFLRGGIDAEPGMTAIAIEAIGTVTLSIAGFLGDSLVVKHLIGPHT